MENEKLIEAVRCFPALWQVGIKAYKDQRLKENAWKEVVSKLCGEWTIELCVKRWKILRDRYVRELKKSKRGKSGDSGPPPTSCWPLFDIMNFVCDTVRHKRTTTNFVPQTSSPVPSTSSSTNTVCSDQEESVCEGTGVDEEEEVLEDRNFQEPKRRKKADVDDVEKCFMKRLEELKKPKQVDEAELFGKHIAARLRSFDPRLFAETCLKIERVMFEAQFPSHATPEHTPVPSRSQSSFYNYENNYYWSDN